MRYLLFLVLALASLSVEAYGGGKDTVQTNDLDLELEIVQYYRAMLERRFQLWLSRSEDVGWRKKYLDYHYRYLFGIGQNSDEILELAWKELERLQGQMEALAKRIEPGLEYWDFLEQIKNDCPRNEKELVEAYRREMGRVASFVQRKGLVSVPDYARFVDAKLGSAKSGYAFGYFLPPRWRKGGSKTGYFVVIAPGKGATLQERRERFRSHNYSWIPAVSAHEGIPGHHLQLAVWAHTPVGLRKLCYNTAFVEGWGLYVERLLDEAGYYTDPRERFAMLQLRAWRAARVIVDQGLYLGFLSEDIAEDILVYQVGLEPLAARLEVAKQRARPFYYSGYFIGYRELLRLRRMARQMLGKRFSLRWFHDTLLRIGPLPFHILEKELKRRILRYKRKK
ncbi:MAG: DUF885 domain-containing protein [Planctomycetota bacterium]|nr:MAG: DUF885 domain-containing protein [Planctomycetota bacterium]